MSLFINYVLYQVGWFACVLGAAWGRPWLGAVIGLGLVAAHCGLVRNHRAELRLILLAALAGLLVDSTLLATGAVRFPNGVYSPWLPPLWMTVLWMQFASTFRYCMRWLLGRYMIGAAFGLLGAPLAFWVGERLGAIQFQEPRLQGFATLALLWAIVIPCLLWCAGRINAEEAEYRLPTSSVKPSAERSKDNV